MKENCIIIGNDGGYLAFDNCGRFTKTRNNNNALIMTFEKAKNILSNQISPRDRCKWHIEMIKEMPKNDIGYQPVSTDNNKFDWTEEINRQETLFSKAFDYKQQLIEMHREVEREICDIQHYMEFFNLDAAKGYKAYKMLQERLIKRRFIKDELIKVGFLLSATPHKFADGTIKREIDRLDDRLYTPRVLVELFESA